MRLSLRFQRISDMARIKVRVKPGARREKIELMADGRLKIQVKEPAVKSRANRALIELLARELQLSRRDISILSGSTSQDKVIEIEGISEQEIMRRLGFD